ncbi:MAG: ACDE family multidrug resistance protein [Parasphingorhabdus sp.]|jgi:ACDE family multidrug resistance protein
MFHRRPAALHQLAPDVGISMARLTGIEGVSRSLLVSIVPLIALDSLGSKEMVSYAYLSGAIFTLCITLNLGHLERLLQRRWVVTLGGCFLALAALLFHSGYAPAFVLGIGMRSAAASLFSVCVSLYIMDYIGKRDLTRVESHRLVFAGSAWLIGPVSGIWLYENVSEGLVFALAAVFAGLMLIYFWKLRLAPNTAINQATSHAANPWRAVMRYMDQPKLRIAYSITLSRSCFWVALFIFGPIYVVEAGLPTWMAGVLLSFVSGLLLFSPIIRRSADRYGTRRIIMIGLIITGVSVISLGLLQSPRPLGLVFWVTGAMGGAMLDVLGNIPFMRTVKPRERVAMTAVFSTWREGSELLTPALVAIILIFAPIWYFYILLGIMHFFSAVTASYLPKRL